MFRKAAAKQIENKNLQFRLRGKEVLRIEAFTDAVFAFAVTLLIVSLEVPETFAELLAVMKGFFAFAISFLLLMEIWHEQNIFFRRYGLHDLRTIWLNGMLIFTVLVFAYPLKFLFSLLAGGFVHHGEEHEPVFDSVNQIPQLMYIYGWGFVIIYVLLVLMHCHAYSKRDQLELTEIEKFDTRTKIFSLSVLVSVGIIVLITTFLSSPEKAGNSGFIYSAIGPALTIFHSRRKKIRRKRFETVGS